MKFNRYPRKPAVRHPLINEVGEGKSCPRPGKQRLQSNWNVVDGQLVCQWQAVNQ